MTKLSPTLGVYIYLLNLTNAFLNVKYKNTKITSFCNFVSLRKINPNNSLKVLKNSVTFPYTKSTLFIFYIKKC